MLATNLVVVLIIQEEAFNQIKEDICSKLHNLIKLETNLETSLFLT
jgi:hypothetical protein